MIVGRLAQGGKLLLAQDMKTEGLRDHGLQLLNVNSLGRDEPVALAWVAPDAQGPRTLLPANSSDISSVYLVCISRKNVYLSSS